MFALSHCYSNNYTFRYFGSSPQRQVNQKINEVLFFLKNKIRVDAHRG